MRYPRLMIAGTGSHVGKTTVTLALLGAFRRRGRQVQPFKAGPDFLDPGHHTAVSGRVSRNLDAWMLTADQNRSIFSRAARTADLSIIEGMMGLFDGISALNNDGSTAQVAKYLAAPVMLVIDGSAMARSAAAMVRGYLTFDPALNVAGVLFNRVQTERHYGLLKQAVEVETNVPVVGYLRADPSVVIPDRHLGLATTTEVGCPGIYERLACAAEATVNVDQVEALARSAGGFTADAVSFVRTKPRTVRVGVAQDAAFCFYYPDNLEWIESEGGQLVPFSPIRDATLPEVDLLYLGGGYPELHAHALASNESMRSAIRDFAERNGTIYAECGGLMYLTRVLQTADGRAYPMVGIFPAKAVMAGKGFTLGYRTLTLRRPGVLGPEGLKVRGHEFHYSSLEPEGPLTYAGCLTDAHSERGMDGLTYLNTLALYTHLHFSSEATVASALVASARAAAVRCGQQQGSDERRR